jgi:hypothetical protein
MTEIAFPGHTICCLRSCWPLTHGVRHAGWRWRSLARSCDRVSL